VDEIGRWLLVMRFLSTSKVPALHHTCVISKKTCNKKNSHELEKQNLMN